MKSSEFALLIYTLIETKRKSVLFEAEERRRREYNTHPNPQFPTPETRLELEHILLVSEITLYYRDLMKVMIEAFQLAKINDNENFEESLYNLLKDYRILPLHTSSSVVNRVARTSETKIFFERLNFYRPTLEQIGLFPARIKSSGYNQAKFKEMYHKFNLREFYDVAYNRGASPPNLIPKDSHEREEGGFE